LWEKRQQYLVNENKRKLNIDLNLDNSPRIVTGKSSARHELSTTRRRKKKAGRSASPFSAMEFDLDVVLREQEELLWQKRKEYLNHEKQRE